jgi:hypothetical protein
MIKGPKLTQAQWKLIASAFSNISQAIILFSAAAFFVPEVVGLTRDFSRITAFIFFAAGLMLLYISVIMTSRKK